MTIATLEVGLYHIALAVALSDSRRGTIAHFKLVTAQLRDRDSAQEVCQPTRSALLGRR